MLPVEELDDRFLNSVESGTFGRCYELFLRKPNANTCGMSLEQPSLGLCLLTLYYMI